MRTITAIFCTAAGLIGLGLAPTAASAPVSSPPAHSAGTTSGTGMAPSGTEAGASAIPWQSVGPGWFVALWVRHAAGRCCPVTPGGQDQRTSLYLVDPLGGRYRVATMPAPASYELADWSGDGRRALVLAPKGGTKYEVEDVYLGTGKVLHHFLASTTNPVTYQFTRPDGLAVLAELQPSTQSGSDELMRLTLSGAKELTYPTTYPGVGVLALGGVLESLDGTELVVEASKGMALVANDGKFIRDIGPAEMCTPERWWTTAAFVASCDTPLNASFLPALWLVHTNGQPSSQLTHPSGHDSGDVNGWQIGSTVYTQALGPCGTEFLARRAADGHMVPVDVPGTNSDVQVVGTEGSRLALRALLGCGGGNSLFWFNPATAKETPLLGPPVNGGDVLGVLAYPGLEN